MSSYHFCPSVAATEKRKSPNLPLQEQKNHSTEKKWQPVVQFGGKYGNHRSLGQATLVSPLYQNETEMVFLDFRFMGDTKRTREGNFGIGKRWIAANNKFILGVYGFYDLRRTEFENLVNQLTFGLEALSESWDYRFNMYYPQNSSKEKETGKVSLSKGEKHVYRQHNEYVYRKTATQSTKVKEIPLKGFDLEIGNAFPGLKMLRLYSAYYHFQGHKGARSIDGARLRGNCQLNEYFSFIAEGSYDNSRKKSGFVGFQIRVPLGEKSGKAKNLTGLDKIMTTRLIERDIDIITNRTPGVVKESAPEVEVYPSKVIPDNYFMEVVEDTDNSPDAGDGTYETPYKVKKSFYKDFMDKEVKEVTAHTKEAYWFRLPTMRTPREKKVVEEKLEQGLIEKISTLYLEQAIEYAVEQSSTREKWKIIQSKVAEKKHQPREERENLLENGRALPSENRGEFSSGQPGGHNLGGGNPLLNNPEPKLNDGRDLHEDRKDPGRGGGEEPLIIDEGVDPNLRNEGGHRPIDGGINNETNLKLNDRRDLDEDRKDPGRGGEKEPLIIDEGVDHNLRNETDNLNKNQRGNRKKKEKEREEKLQAQLKKAEKEKEKEKEREKLRLYQAAEQEKKRLEQREREGMEIREREALERTCDFS